MAQSSRPQPGNRSSFATYVDSGPYSGNQWASLFRVLFTGDQETTQGVLKSVWGELVATHPVANLNLQIDMGSGICNGHWYQNTTAVTIAVSATGGGSRSDTLVLLENNTNAPLTAGPGNAYDTVGNVSIPPYSVRLAVVKGVGITQNLALWMVPLYTFTTGAANITSLADARTYCQFATMVTADKIEDRTRRFFVPVMIGRNTTDGTDITPAVFTAGQYAGILMPDNKVSVGHGTFCIPTDYSSSMTVTAVTSTLWLAGNAYVSNTCYYGECSQGRAAHSDVLGSTAEAVNATNFYCIKSVSLSLPSTNDIVGCRFSRNATAGADTLSADLQFFGWIVSYTADS